MLGALVSDPRAVLAIVALLCIFCSICAALFFYGLWKWTELRRGPKRPLAPARVRPPREEPVDLAKERYEYCSRRDAYAEERQLRRVA